MNRIHEVPLRHVQITDAFWSERQRIIAETVVPHMERILRDEVPGAEKSHAFENFRIAAGESEGAFYGMVFQDTDVYKWLETASYSLLVKPDPELEARMDAMIATIARAQQPDGYLNTYFTLVEPDKKWSNLLECHELYCAGHMIEAAVGHYEVTGRRNLLEIGIRLADCILERFMDSDAIPGHQEIELALMRLYHATGDERYCEMALRFLNRRGQDPSYFRKHTPQHPGIHYGGYDIDPDNAEYNQSYAPVREQRQARGHAVRMMYMLAAMADAAEATQDEGLYAACQNLWENITGRQMYITGGLGATARYEAFLPDYELPNDTAYAETCASVAMAFFARRMLNISPEGRYADVLELELYNGALSGMQLDGTRFFYVNPLEVVPGVAGVQSGYEHVLPERARWLTCACCPPNLSRLIASLGRYCWSEAEDAVCSHLFIGNRARMRLADVELETGYPWKGGAKYTLHPHTGEPFSLMVHIPAYLDDLQLLLNGRLAPVQRQDGYLRIHRCWAEGDCVELRFALTPRRVHADPRVQADAGCVALAYGPMIYCFEAVDNGSQLARLRIPADAKLGTGGFNALKVLTLTVNGTLTAIPYFAWSNRGLTEMRVWMRE